MEAIAKISGYYRWLLPALKAALLLLLFAALYWQVFARPDADLLWLQWQQSLHLTRWPWLLTALALMPLNWAFETLKWRQFTRVFSQMSFGQAYRAVLAGVALSLITPQRLGEYGGRALLSPVGQRWQMVVATLLGNFGQFIVLIAGGLGGFLWLAYNHLAWQTYLLYVAAIGIVIVIIALIFGFFHVQYVLPGIRAMVPVRIWKKLRRSLVLLRACPPRWRWSALGWATARYLTYATQYWLMLLFLGIDVPPEAAFASIATIFLIQTGIPLPLFGALLARAEIALFVWGQFDANELSILAATFGLFIINLALPALPGAIFIVRINKTKSSAYEKINA